MNTPAPAPANPPPVPPAKSETVTGADLIGALPPVNENAVRSAAGRGDHLVRR